MFAERFITIERPPGGRPGRRGTAVAAAGRSRAPAAPRHLLFAEPHDAEPQAHHAGQAERGLAAGLGHVEGGGHYRRRHARLAGAPASGTARDERDGKKRPQIRVEHAARILGPAAGHGVE